jgi:uncharacterized protein YggE
MRLSVIAGAAMAAVAVAPLAAQESGAAARPARPVSEIITSAQGEAKVTPDRATVFVGVETRSATAAQASAENARKQQAVMDALHALGIARDRISTMSYNVMPEQSFQPNQGDKVPRIVGYRVTNTIRVEVRQLDQVGAVLDAAIAHGANTINSLDFFASDQDSARHAALAEAVARARGDAEVLARAAGGHLGTLISLTTSQTFAPRPGPMMSAARLDAAVQTPITPGEETVTVQVSARWRFVEGD